MSVEDRLHALVAQTRQQQGDAFIASPALLVPRLSSQAPDLYGEIRALAAAFEMDAPRLVAGAPDAAAESARIATQIAGRERLSMAVCLPAVSVACRIGPLAAAAAPALPIPAAGAGWAGDSVIAAPPAAAAYAPPPYAQPAYAPPAYSPPYAAEQPGAAPAAEPLYKNKWAIGAAGAVCLLVLYQLGQRQQATPQMQPAQPQQNPGGQMPMQPQGGQVPPQGGQMPGGQMPQGGQMPPQAGPGGGTGAPPIAAQGQEGNGPPLLQPPGGNLPALAVQRGANGAPMIFFRVQTRSGPAQAMIGLPPGGWDSGPAMFGLMRAGNTGGQPDTMGSASFRRQGSQSGPARTAQPVWNQDNAGVGDVCVAFMGSPGGQDVALSGATMCVMDASCGQAAGCGRMP